MRLFVSMLWVLVAGCGATYDGPRSEIFDGSTFRHHEEVPDRDFSTFLKWVSDRDQSAWPDWVQIPQASKPPARSKALRVQFINHATVLVQVDDLNILTDPIWSERASPVSFAGPARHKAPGLAFEELPKIDVVLISHNHYDHMDVPTLQRLQARDQPKILVGLGNAEYLADEEVEATDVSWWDTTRIGDVALTFTPSQHWSARGMFDRGKTLWGAFYIKGPNGSVYFAGDTGFGPHFAQTRKRLGAPDVALLPIGAYEPRWFMAAHHMNPDDAVSAHVILGAKQSLGIHWGTFQLTDEGLQRPVLDLGVAMKRHGVLPEAFQALENGGVLK